jgi:predicted CXXCH cytochrome family protein
MNTLTLLLLISTATVIIDCASWEYPELKSMSLPATVPSGKSCAGCHEDEFATWKKTRHGDAKRMQKIGIAQLSECGACHQNLEAHARNPDSAIPASINNLSKTEQNLLCGKCHYNQRIFGLSAINPHDRHGLFMSYGLEGRRKQASCLDCHQGHLGKADMLKSIRAHTCFRCHKESIVSMGVFQPLNYLTFGKTCLGCHPAHGGSAPEQLGRMAIGAVVTCFICHPTGDLNRIGFQPAENQSGME